MRLIKRWQRVAHFKKLLQCSKLMYCLVFVSSCVLVKISHFLMHVNNETIILSNSVFAWYQELAKLQFVLSASARYLALAGTSSAIIILAMMLNLIISYIAEPCANCDNKKILILVFTSKCFNLILSHECFGWGKLFDELEIHCTVHCIN